MAMTRQKIEDALEEARAFIAAGTKVLDKLTDEKRDRDLWYETRNYDGPTPPRGPQPDDYSFGSKETGSFRRRSLDLTRTLAELRK